jgi:DNA polymerase-4
VAPDPHLRSDIRAAAACRSHQAAVRREAPRAHWTRWAGPAIRTRRISWLISLDVRDRVTSRYQLCSLLATAGKLLVTMSRNDAWPRTILHVDLDAFFASVHQRNEPGLRGRPIVVAGRSSRPVVISASNEARLSGVHVAQLLQEAFDHCPALVAVRPDYTAYREASRQVQTILRRFTSPELIERIALDEIYLDITARTRHGTSSPEDVARRIKYAIFNELGLTTTIGVATSKPVAKIAGAIRRPDGLALVQPGTEEEFLFALSIDLIPGLDLEVREKLQGMGIGTLGKLARHDTQRLIQILGPSGALLQRMAQGRDRSPVIGLRPVQTFSAETTLETGLADPVQIDEVLQRLVGRIAGRLLSEGVRARTVSVKVKLMDSGVISRQVSRTSPTDSAEVILRVARAAFQHSWVECRPIRLLGVAVSGLEHPKTDLQLHLFGSHFDASSRDH